MEIKKNPKTYDPFGELNQLRFADFAEIYQNEKIVKTIRLSE